MTEGDLSGQRIGEYVVVGPIGRGGMGMVYEGRQPMIGKRVAIKVLLQEFSGRQEVIERFLSEARAANAIRHRGIVDIFSFGELPDGTHYCVMEFLEGAPFDQVIRLRAPIPPADVLRWADEAFDALGAAHRAGVVHRDIKPSNLFLVDTGYDRPHVKLLDFGIAKLATALESADDGGQVVGTPDYMAPEQARGEEVTGAADFYSLGCVLFELLTRERLFPGETPLDMMMAHIKHAPRKPSSLEAGIGADLDAFVGKLLSKKPLDRPRSAMVAREEIHVLLHRLNEAPSLPPPSAYTTHMPKVITGVGISPVATPRPGWNEDDRGAGATWMSTSKENLVSSVARTQLAAPLITAEPSATQPAIPAEPALPPPPVRRSSPALIASTAVASALAAWLFLERRPSAGDDVAPRGADKPIAAPEVPKPAVVAIAEPPPPAVALDAGATEEPAVDAGAAVAAPSLANVTKPSHKPTPKASAPTARALLARVSRLRKELKDLEARRGGEQKVMRSLLDALEQDVKSAQSPAELKAASRAIDELQQQIRG